MYKSNLFVAEWTQFNIFNEGYASGYKYFEYYNTINKHVT